MPRPRFAPRERTPGTHWIGGWVDPRAGLDAGARRKILCPCRRSNSDRPARSQILYRLSYRGSGLNVPIKITESCDSECIRILYLFFEGSSVKKNCNILIQWELIMKLIMRCSGGRSYISSGQHDMKYIFYGVLMKKLQYGVISPFSFCIRSRSSYATVRGSDINVDFQLWWQT
jgi:hypothetical protein